MIANSLPQVVQGFELQGLGFRCRAIRVGKGCMTSGKSLAGIPPALRLLLNMPSKALSRTAKGAVSLL